jgi:hypothetical protein
VTERFQENARRAAVLHGERNVTAPPLLAQIWLIGAIADALSCRVADVAFSHIYALNWMPSPAAAIVNSAFRPAGSAPNAEYECLSV